jgi:precorrin-6Y C5,15-methyltransferase (decarboxylating)
MNRHYIIIGLSNRPADNLPAGVSSFLPSMSVFSGGDRHYQLVRQLLPAGHVWIPIKGNMSELFAAYREVSEPNIVVFASGDPLFYGIAQTIRQNDPEASIKVYSGLNSVQLLCMRLGQPYAGIKNTSVHGRGWQELDAALLRGEPFIAVLTDAANHPGAIAQRLLDYGFDSYEMIVGEDLDGADERIGRHTLQEATCQRFHPLNCVLLRWAAAKRPAIGIDDACFDRLPGRPNMITKKPLRLLTLSALQLHQARVFWDIGFCTGALSIEARRLFPPLQVLAFERRAECADILQRNMRKLSAPGIRSIMGDFFDQDLAALPAPDALFIGGHGGRLPELLQRVDGILESGFIAMNAVLDSSREQWVAVTRTLGWELVATDTLIFNQHNPVTLLVCRKTKLI